MAYVLHLAEKENIVLSHATAERLLRLDNGDAALLYLYLLQRGNGAAPERACQELGWGQGRLSAAEDALQKIGLVSARAEAPVEPPQETVEYSREDVIQTLQEDNRFALLTGEIEKTLGKKLNSRDMQQLLGLYDQQGLPAEVIYQLVNHCLERTERAYGPGRRPTMRQIEKEGFAWARRGIFTLEQAEAYLREYAKTQGRLPELMAVLGLGQRAPVPSEEKYLLTWVDWGFPAETVALAYDKTVLHCGGLKWPYLNGILRRWHEEGKLDVQQAEAEAPHREEKAAAPSAEVERMRKYLQALHRETDTEKGASGV